MMYAGVRYFWKINKKSCNFNILDEKCFPGKKRAGIKPDRMLVCHYGTAYKEEYFFQIVTDPMPFWHGPF